MSGPCIYHPYFDTMAHRMVKVLLLFLMAAPLYSSAQSSTVSQPIVLWPKGAPGGGANELAEVNSTKASDRMVADKAVIRIANVNNPTITVYSPPKELNTGAAVIVCPGGGYSILAIDLEGTEVCQWFNSIGVTAILLKYRVPVKAGAPRYQAPLQDAQRAMGWARQHASQYGITGKIGIMGFSAGGHLSATLSTNYSKRTYETVDAADALSCRPDFVMLVYPAYLTVKEEGDKIAPELPVTNNTPPTLLIQTQDDGVRVESSLFYYLALKNAEVPAEMHLYAKGGHGYGMRGKGNGIDKWPERAREWLQTIGILASK